MRSLSTLCAGFLMLPAVAQAEMDAEFSGYLEGELRAFLQNPNPIFPINDAGHWGISLSTEPRLELSWDDGDSLINVAGFGRVDSEDSNRTHADIRELVFIKAMDRWEIRLGVDKVFWGVVESNHLVDVINQDDALEDVDGEDKLGQPLAAVSYDSDIGLFSAYVMPFFRERKFAGPDGRPNAGFPVRTDLATFESGAEEWHVDVAARWSHSTGPYDLALSYFRGTDRDPQLRLTQAPNSSFFLAPHYVQIDQVGAELQGTFEALLVKAEAIHKWSRFEDYFAVVGGFEYSFYGLGSGASDLGFLAEYHYDERGEAGSSPFESDIFVGARWALNDVDDSQVLAGVIPDLNRSARAVTVEASRRIGDEWRVTLDARLFFGFAANDPLFPFADDDFVQLRVARWF